MFMKKSMAGVGRSSGPAPLTASSSLIRLVYSARENITPCGLKSSSES
jgi:hypothetical protein